MGNPIKYNNTAEGDIDELLTAFDGAEIDQVDAQNALNMAIYGRAYEYIYAKEGLTELDSTSIDQKTPSWSTMIALSESLCLRSTTIKSRMIQKILLSIKQRSLQKICTITWF